MSLCILEAKLSIREGFQTKIFSLTWPKKYPISKFASKIYRMKLSRQNERKIGNTFAFGFHPFEIEDRRESILMKVEPIHLSTSISDEFSQVLHTLEGVSELLCRYCCV